jgi:hypothetical protein
MYSWESSESGLQMSALSLKNERKLVRLSITGQMIKRYMRFLNLLRESGLIW